MIKASVLSDIGTITHGFFTRKGGVSGGIYASLNTGLGADEDKQIVLKNRQIVADRLGAETLVTPYQYHSAVVEVVETAWHWDVPARADALVTARPGIAIGVNTADCTPVIFADEVAGVIGVAHSGWKGTVAGVLENTVASMTEQGADRARIVAAIGPTISQENYEVGPEFVAQFVADDAGAEKYFVPSVRNGHAMFDLPACVFDRLERLGLKQVQNLSLCTYGDTERFFSYRRMCHRGEPDYGRQMSAVCLKG